MKRSTLLMLVLASFATFGLATQASAQDAPAGPEGDEDVDVVQPGTEVGPAQIGVPQAPTEPVVSEPPPPPPVVPVAPTRETACNDRVDDDGDGMVDCADADCFGNTLCEAGGSEERTPAACSDWIDNDGDAGVDCEDPDCADFEVCQGSMPSGGGSGGGASHGPVDEDLPELGEGMSVEDLLGRGSDNNGERNDFVCSDGVDNDGDGRIDCQDFGCRFDPAVTVCSNSPGMRFSVVAGIGASVDFNAPANERGDIRFTRLQLRALGPIPSINNSFFLLSMRMERSPRLTFAHFQIPLSNRGHYLALNSGSGSLSTGLIISAAKQPLLDAPFYLFNAFEQGNGAALETGGPIDENGRLMYRLFVAGGSGEFNGNVGGRFFRSEDRNFTYTMGAQLQFNLVGHFNRFDSPFLYTKEPLAIGATIGFKYDQRAEERFPAGNAYFILRTGRFLLRAETYMKYELDFGSFQAAYNVQTSILLVPQKILFAADFGQFMASDYQTPPGAGEGPRDYLNETQWRVALHWYWYRNIGILSLMFRQTFLEENPSRPEDPTREDELRIEAQFRF